MPVPAKTLTRWTRWLARWLYNLGRDAEDPGPNWSELVRKEQRHYLETAQRMIAAFDDDVAALQWLERLATRKDPS